MQSSNGDTDIVNRLVADKLSIFFVKVEKNEKTDTTKCKEKKQSLPDDCNLKSESREKNNNNWEGGLPWQSSG